MIVSQTGAAHSQSHAYSGSGDEFRAGESVER